MKTVNFIGTGKLGLSLAKTIAKLPNYQIVNIYNRKPSTSAQAINLIGQGAAALNLSELAAVDITFILTPDAAIEDCANALATSHAIKEKSLIVHMSGIQSSSILSALKAHDCSIASIHPLKAFGAIHNDCLNNIYCAIEGDTFALESLLPLLEQLKAKPLKINQQDKVLYHSAAVFASNFSVTLHHIACEQLIISGIDKDKAHEITSALMTNAIMNIDAVKDHKEALTGPIKRDDLDTVKQHLNAQPSKEIKALYRHLARETFNICHSDNKEKLCHDILDEIP